jgi:hypothetical protein
MTNEAREAALAERERIARLADECNATYELKGRREPFAQLIRGGATRPPWAWHHRPDPLAVPTET